jgi:hypothetical protein
MAEAAAGTAVVKIEIGTIPATVADLAASFERRRLRRPIIIRESTNEEVKNDFVYFTSNNSS